MGLETGTFVDDLVVTNPPGGDFVSQGDDHIRLLKTVLRNTFKRASKAFSLPGVLNKSANYTVLSTDDNFTIECDTSGGAFTLTLPSLAVGDAGWAVYVVKKNTGTNPVFLQPASGTINGFTKIRRTIEFTVTKVLWTGTVWVASRPNGGSPVGTVISFYGTALPNGHLWADGTTFTAADFVELNSAFGGNLKPDCRGNVEAGRDNMGVGAANRLSPVLTFDPTIIASLGGFEAISLVTDQLPAHSHPFTTGNQSADHTHSGTTGNQNATHTHTGTASAGDAHKHTVAIQALGSDINAGGVNVMVPGGSTDTSFEATHTHPVTTLTESANHQHAFTSGGVSAGHTHSGTTGDTGLGDPYYNVQPTIICNKIVVAE